MNKKETTLDNKIARMEIRLTQSEKKLLKKQAKKSNMNISEYIRTLICNADSNTGAISPKKAIAIKCIATELMNCVSKDTDPNLEKEIRKLWKLLQSNF